MFLSLGLLVQTLIDLRYKIIPDQITLPAIVTGLTVSSFFPGIHGQSTPLGGFFQSLLGTFLGGGFLYAAGTVAEWVLKKEAMGGGDVKLLAAVGAVIGWRGVLWTIFISSLTGSVIGVYLRVTQGEELIPYGPYLALGAFSYLFVGPQAIQWYLGVLGKI